MTKEVLAREVGLDLNDEVYLSIYGGNKINNYVYFIIDYGNHDSSNDVGWRYSYRRSKTLYLKYDVNKKS